MLVRVTLEMERLAYAILPKFRTAGKRHRPYFKDDHLNFSREAEKLGTNGKMSKDQSPESCTKPKR